MEDTLITRVKSLLAAGDTEGVVSILDSNKEEFCTASSNIIPVISEYLNDDTLKSKNEVFQCCESLINQISQSYCPEEALLEFIEQAEDCDDTKFSVMLKAMQTSILRFQPGTMENSIDWCSNTILRHIYEMCVPDDLKLEGNETTLAEVLEPVRNINRVYSSIVDFYNAVPHLGRTTKPLLKLLGKPLAYTDLSDGTDFRIYALSIMTHIQNSNTDLLQFLDCIDVGSDTDVQSFLDAEFVNMPLGVFYYLIFYEGIFLNEIPQVYSPVFVVERTLRLSQVLLCFSHSVIQKKGLLLASTVLERVKENEIKYETTDHHFMGKFIETLAGIMIYSEVKDNRQTAVTVFKKLFFRLNPKGRFIVLLNIQEAVDHPGFIGYLATLMKDIVAKTLDDPQEGREFFSGKNLCDLLEKFCRLHSGVETDLIEMSDRLVSCLNLIRFLAIRDTNNLTGFWDISGTLTLDFLEPLKKGLTLSKAHYKLQLDDLNGGSSGDSGKVDVKVGSTVLPPMSKKQKVQVLYSALNTFDLIESLLSRVNECLALHK